MPKKHTNEPSKGTFRDDPKPVVKDAPKLYRINLACGDVKVEGFKGVDKFKTTATDIIHDLTKTPWPFKDNSVDEAYCSHFFEHLDGEERISFMNELYRILKKGAKVAMITPYWSSMRAIQDPTHKWPPVCESSYLYFNKGFRVQNKLEHYLKINCDFDFTYGYSLDGGITSRTVEYQQFATKHYTNAISDLHVTLVKR